MMLDCQSDHGLSNDYGRGRQITIPKLCKIGKIQGTYKAQAAVIRREERLENHAKTWI